MQIKKKISKLNKLYIIFFYSVLFINVIFSTSLNANTFKITNLEISEPFELNFNKEKVINKGFKIAFLELASMITTSGDKKKIKKTSLSKIKGLIDSFTMSDERFINNEYYVKFDVNFNKKNTLNFFEKKNIFPSIPQKKEILLIPVFVDLQSSQVSLFNDNIFYDNWNLKKERFFLLNYILPTEDLEDVNLILKNSDSIEEYDFKNIVKKYNLEDFIIVIIYKNFNEFNILSKIQLNNLSKIENQTFKEVNIEEDQSLNSILNELKNTYENYWKGLNKINTSIKLPLHVSVDSSEYKKILNLENVLDELDLVFSYEISQFDNEMIYYKIIYNGAPNKFLIDLKTKGIVIDTQKQNWKIE